MLSLLLTSCYEMCDLYQFLELEEIAHKHTIEGSSMNNPGSMIAARFSHLYFL